MMGGTGELNDDTGPAGMVLGGQHGAGDAPTVVGGQPLVQHRRQQQPDETNKAVSIRPAVRWRTDIPSLLPACGARRPEHPAAAKIRGHVAGREPTPRAVRKPPTGGASDQSCRGIRRATEAGPFSAPEGRVSFHGHH
jgi:hypothetical protein